MPPGEEWQKSKDFTKWGFIFWFRIGKEKQDAESGGL